MRKFILLLTLAFAAISASAQTGYITNVGPSQFKSGFEADKNARIVDVRQDWEYKKGHIANAQNIDVMADDFEQKIAQIPFTTTVYIYCYSGGRSMEAAEKMKEMGFKKIVNLNGGMAAWEKALLPVEK